MPIWDFLRDAAPPLALDLWNAGKVQRTRELGLS